MRVMIIARLFSGLYDSVRSENWAPSGVPAIYKLVEGLAERPDTDLITVFIVKDSLPAWAWRDRSYNFPKIGAVRLVGWRPLSWLRHLGLDGKVREIAQLMRVLMLVIRNRPDVCYVTNANFIIGAVLSILRIVPVIIRFLGLHPEQKRIAARHRGAQAWLYRAPFARAICSLDGSGGAVFLPKLLHPRVPLDVLLNGVDQPVVRQASVDELRKKLNLADRPTVLFVGRLEVNKGVQDFVEALITVLRRRGADAVNAIVVGGGSQHAQLSSRVSKAGCGDRIHMVGPIAHADIAGYLAVADIYVSLNRYGSLSNANLEAMASGCCLIMLQPETETATDVETQTVIPADAAICIGRNAIPDDLVRALEQLLDRREMISDYKERMRRAMHGKLKSWNERIMVEMELIKSVAVGRG